jgi:hypothetical protein
MSDPFDGPRLKLARARRHIADYRLAFNALAKSNIIEILPQVGPEGDWYKVQLNKPMPPDMRLTAADTLYNFRSALDQAMCRSVALAGRNPKDTYFPHGKDRVAFEASLLRACKKVPERVRDAVIGLEPYHGGAGYLLRVLHELNIEDKHSDLIGVGAALRKIAMLPGNGPKPAGGQVWRRGEHDFERAEPDAPIEGRMVVTMAVTFLDIEAIEGRSVTAVLNEIDDEATRAVDAIVAAATASASTA